MVKWSVLDVTESGNGEFSVWDMLGCEIFFKMRHEAVYCAVLLNRLKLDGKTLPTFNTTDELIDWLEEKARGKENIRT